MIPQTFSFPHTLLPGCTVEGMQKLLICHHIVEEYFGLLAGYALPDGELGFVDLYWIDLIPKDRFCLH